MSTALDSLSHKVQRAAVGTMVDVALAHVNKDRQKAIAEMVDVAKQIYGDSFSEETYEQARAVLERMGILVAQTTKRALEASLKKLLLRKPLNKITISDITEDCGVNRMTFYYHFKDIYDLVDWILMEDAAEALEGLQDFETWSGALREMLEKVQANRVLVLNVYRSVSREQVEQYLYKMLDPLLRIFVERLNIPVKEEDKQFIIDFYKYGFVGLALEWIRRDMKTDPAVMAERLNTIMQGDLKRALQRFRTDGKASIETD